MTSYQEVRETVGASGLDDWIPFQSRGTWTYRSDVSLRITRENQIDSGYAAPWTRGIQGNNARFGYYMYYAGSPVEYHVVVSIDDGRAHIPEPSHHGGNSYTITPYEANVAQIVSGDTDTFQAYLNRTPIVVDR